MLSNCSVKKSRLIIVCVAQGRHYLLKASLRVTVSRRDGEHVGDTRGRLTQRRMAGGGGR